MSGKKDPTRQWIDRHVAAPVVSYDWAPTQRELLLGRDHNGMIEEWRKVSERIKKRRSSQPVGSQMYNACEEALGLIAFITKAGMVGAIQGNWCPGHEILATCASLYEWRHGKIDPLVQAMIREAMDEAYTSERFES